MDRDASGAMNPPTVIAFCLSGAVVLYLWLYSRLARVHLRQVYPATEDPEQHEQDTDIDIIAIHGLDTNSEETWTWKDPKHPGVPVNWLQHDTMLPSKVKRVRIFTCDWSADLLQPSDLVQKTEEEFALLLLEDIQRERQMNGHASATRGIIFLATPFRGTSFRDVAAFTEPCLQFWALIRGRQVSNLLSITKESTFDIEKLVRDFTLLCQDEEHPCQVFNFYEKGKTSLPSKVFPWLPAWLRQEKQLVNKSSATLDIVRHPLPLSRPHGLMNKFSHSTCSDHCKQPCEERGDFDLVCGKIQEFLQKIREGSPIKQADDWIRENCYTEDKLKIERLSGERLLMDRCYINLAIVEQPMRDAARSKKELKNGDAPPSSSQFSLQTRLKIETPEENVQIDLPTLFKERKDSNNKTIKPRRILIRGRAGVGKTTLCKKIVYEFSRRSEEFRHWNQLFDRVLWVPLRKLKELPPEQYDLEGLFYYEYFAQQKHEIRTTSVNELRRSVENRTLFILDGLDEIFQELSHKDYKSGFLEQLLNQPDVIITSRPHASFPAGTSPPDLELETIGFYPDQVKAYIEKAFVDPETGNPDSEKSGKVQSFLRRHWLLESLVQIPIQLDALCYPWDDHRGKDMLQTMTTIYQAIERRLWKKDAVRLGKQLHDGQRLTDLIVQPYHSSEIEGLVETELRLLESLAFTGLHSDVIDFQPWHRDEVSKQFKPAGVLDSLDNTFARLSFLRTSDSSSDGRSREYHFLHLTYQEYFAARYFGDVKKTKPTTFLQEHKYDPRYDIFWRFVAGLGGKTLGFFQAIEEEPCDLSTYKHQHLVINCLKEMLFECDFIGTSRLVCEMELPVLVSASPKSRIILFKSLYNRPVIPSEVIHLAMGCLKGNDSHIRWRAIIILGKQSQLSDEALGAIIIRLGDKNWSVQLEAIKILRKQSQLSDKNFKAIITQFEDKDSNIRSAAIKTFREHSQLNDEALVAIITRLDDENSSVRLAAIQILREKSQLSYKTLEAIIARCDDQDWSVRWKALNILGKQSQFSDKTLEDIIARCDDQDWSIRWEALNIFEKQSQFSDKTLEAIIARDKTFETLEVIIARWHDKDSHIQWDAIKILGKQSQLSDKVLEAILARLDDEVSGGIQCEALEILGRQSQLSDKVLQAIAARLDDKDTHVRWGAIDTLREQSELSDEVLEDILARLDREYVADIRYKIIDTLGKQSLLSDKALKAIIERLNDHYPIVQSAAIRILGKQSQLSDEALEAAINILPPFFWEHSFARRVWAWWNDISF
ncbi:hypothetical protein B0T17DRAFT_607771 [Bombardia bombarda]|uniref:NACHT domain-containing protein n=1 Tax=Bombardia bombarda TaxID=252184 RepID=A0AA39XBY4_9PEZI|nr:hypothetical protein B0T17DRAFT_607771 [Bombardia bombarda]